MNTNDLFKAVMNLDLSPIKSKLMHVESGEGWKLEKANAVEKEYRRFLILMKMYPEENTAPLVDVDTFWHYHILDTMKYATDCDAFFGYFLHHYPYVGMRGEDDEQFRLDSGERMRTLYETTFGEDYPGAHASAEETPTMLTFRNTIGVQTQLKGDISVDTTAWCAGPHSDIAWCAGPHIKQATAAAAEGALSAGSAWCAGPHSKVSAMNAANSTVGATAWCAGPHAKIDTVLGKETSGAVTAWCAGPHGKKQKPFSSKTLAPATAWCAGPHGKQAPIASAGATNISTAWCAGPHAKTGNSLILATK